MAENLQREENALPLWLRYQYLVSPSMASPNPDYLYPDMDAALSDARTIVEEFVPEIISSESDEDEDEQPTQRPPASVVAVADLPVFTFVNKDAELENYNCDICREPTLVDVMKKMPCKHEFHQECLESWLKSSNCCPTCRYELPTDDLKYELKKEVQMARNASCVGEYMYL